MLSAFEATITAYFGEKPGTRYELLMVLRRRTIYWSGSSGALYSAVDRLVKKKILTEVPGQDPRVFRATPLGKEKCRVFFGTPVPAVKTISEPSILRLKLRASEILPEREKIDFFQAQQLELLKAEEIVRKERRGTFGQSISEELADLTIEQLRLERNFIEKRLHILQAEPGGALNQTGFQRG